LLVLVEKASFSKEFRSEFHSCGEGNMTPPPKLGHSWVVFEGWSQIFWIEQSCSAMATQKLRKKYNKKQKNKKAT